MGVLLPRVWYDWTAVATILHHACRHCTSHVDIRRGDGFVRRQKFLAHHYFPGRWWTDLGLIVCFHWFLICKHRPNVREWGDSWCINWPIFRFCRPFHPRLYSTRWNLWILGRGAFKSLSRCRESRMYFRWESAPCPTASQGWGWELCITQPHTTPDGVGSIRPQTQNETHLSHGGIPYVANPCMLLGKSIGWMGTA